MRTTSQMAREAAVLIEVEKIRAEERRSATRFSEDRQPGRTEVPNSAPPADQGKSRDVVAAKVGFKSGHDAARAIKAIKKVDELKQRGDKVGFKSGDG